MTPKTICDSHGIKPDEKIQDRVHTDVKHDKGRIMNLVDLSAWFEYFADGPNVEVAL